MKTNSGFKYYEVIMIKEIKLVNFRNFKEKKLENLEKENFIVWENWKGKTNLLEAISRIWNNSLTKLNFKDLVRLKKDYFFIEIINDKGEIFSLYYSSKEDKKSYMINNKKVSKRKFIETSYSCVIFSPITMNMLYLSPGLRRDFLDDTLKSSFSMYDKILKDYKKVLKSRNSTLKAINLWKANREDIKFWDEKFIELSIEIYSYRLKLVKFLEKSIVSIKEVFSIPVETIKFYYVSKIDRNDIKKSLKEYLETNFERDLILQKTNIWPHIDDFEILIDDRNISYFASRWEVKSIIIYLKLLEWLFIEKISSKKPIMIIDDFLSELDNEHKELLLKKMEYYQSFISTIFKTEEKTYIMI